MCWLIWNWINKTLFFFHYLKKIWASNLIKKQPHQKIVSCGEIITSVSWLLELQNLTSTEFQKNSNKQILVIITCLLTLMSMVDLFFHFYSTSQFCLKVLHALKSTSFFSFHKKEQNFKLYRFFNFNSISTNQHCFFSSDESFVGWKLQFERT